MTILDQFLNDLAGAPEDWTLRGVLADWADDNSQPQLAECLRWMIRCQKRPYPDKSGRGTWFNAETIRKDLDLGDPESDIPAALFTQLEGGDEVKNHRLFKTLRAAEEAFQAAWVKAREKGWKPE
jgi:uncharacterized protein (TIGR02996 family)